MDNNNKKLDFDFDFLGEDKDPIEEQKERVEKIIIKINNVSKIADVVEPAQIDVLLEDVSITSEKLSNSNLYDDIFAAIVKTAK